VKATIAVLTCTALLSCAASPLRHSSAGGLARAFADGQARPPALLPVAPLAFDRVRTSQRLVALTFDCCQTQKPAGFDAKIVSFLIAHRVPATLFLGGRWIETHPGPMKTLAAVPYFELENHSYIHPHMMKVSQSRQSDELLKTQRLLAKAGRTARFFRPPYGEWNATTRSLAARAGMQVVTWTVVTGDPDPNAGVSDLMAAFRRAKPGSIVIMHANGRGWHTAAALPQMLEWLRKERLKPVMLKDLVAAGTPVAIPSPR